MDDNENINRMLFTGTFMVADNGETGFTWLVNSGRKGARKMFGSLLE
jgi:hypothetical protein